MEIFFGLKSLYQSRVSDFLTGLVWLALKHGNLQRSPAACAFFIDNQYKAGELSKSKPFIYL